VLEAVSKEAFVPVLPLLRQPWQAPPAKTRHWMYMYLIPLRYRRSPRTSLT